jgi:hypothetical protein
MENISDYLSSIGQGISAEEKTVKVARLIILLIKIEKELTTVKSTLIKLKNYQQKYRNNPNTISEINQKVDTVDKLLGKIRKARFNLNYYFI